MKGQALVEFALILPLQLLIILGGTQLGLLIVERTRLTHAAQEAAIAGATSPASCPIALQTADDIYGSPIDAKTCDQQGQQIEVRLTRPAVSLLPFLPEFVSVTARAVLR